MSAFSPNQTSICPTAALLCHIAAMRCSGSGLNLVTQSDARVGAHARTRKVAAFTAFRGKTMPVTANIGEDWGSGA